MFTKTHLSLFVLVFFSILALGSTEEEQKKQDEEVQQKVKSLPSVELSAYDLYLENYKNSARANQQYKGKVLKITGSVREIVDGVFGATNVWLEDDICCVFSEENISDAAKMNIGNEVVIIGEYKGSGIMEGCYLDKINF
jgi:hypothetical protein